MPLRVAVPSICFVLLAPLVMPKVEDAAACLQLMPVNPLVPVASNGEEDVGMLVPAIHTEIQKNATMGLKGKDNSTAKPLMLLHLSDNPLAHRSELYRKNLGIKMNAHGDLPAFLTAIMVGTGAFVTGAVLLSILRLSYPIMYSHNCMGERPLVKYKSKDWEESFFGWCSAVNDLFRTPGCCAGGCGLLGRLVNWQDGTAESFPEDVLKAVGLDHAMLLFYCQLCSKILLVLSLPSILLFMPINCFLGHGVVGDDYLSVIGFANIRDDSYLLWFYALTVWFVVAVVQYYIFKAQEVFLDRRQDWLLDLPYPQCNTILVEQIPDEYRSDAKLKEFFNSAFDENVVDECYVMRKVEVLETANLAIETNQHLLEDAQAEFKRTGERPVHARLRTLTRVDSIEEYMDEVANAKAAQTEELAHLDVAIASKEADTDRFWAAGFVTFKKRQTRELALTKNFTADLDQFMISSPPRPSCIEYKFFCVEPNAAARAEAIGNLMIVGIFFAFLPVVVLVSSLLQLEYLQDHIGLFKLLVDHYPVLTTVWNGIVGPAALTAVVGFVPTFIVMALQSWHHEKSPAWLQHKIQVLYFAFNVIFVLLVTAIGSSLVAMARDIWEHPNIIFQRLAETMPASTHFYLKFLPAQWTSFAMVLTRWVPLLKFLGIRKAVGDDKRAKELAEPEDQDWYGMGARSARLALYMTIAIVFSTLTPLITVVGVMTFYIARVVYGYLFVFAEQKKEDLGGIFWVSTLKHTQQGVFIYVALMCSVLFQRSSSIGPGLIALGAFLPTYYYYVRLERAFDWEHLPFMKLKSAGQSGVTTAVKDDSERYVQPELRT